MVDEKKTILMTKLAIFEKHEKNKSLVVSKYYRSDYVRYNTLKTWVAVTILYWSLIAGYVFMAFDSILEKLNDLDYFAIVYKMLGGYVVVCGIYFLFSFILYNYRYKKIKEGLIQYNVNLKALIHVDDTPGMKNHMLEESGRTTDNVSQARVTDSEARARVSRSDIIQRQLQEQQERKNQEIIENVKRRNERLSAQQELEQQKLREMEEERRRIRARREQLEREQLQRIRQQSQTMTRENHVYNTNVQNGAGRGEQ